ncbi:hypothetical protein PVAND_009039 [Polypedilum vanderplanki]|uniref:GB1/RHD3-type G domain-containing protein n=1 Tax=Polypedilum vanderplanki TaxID=319348 RepID=A0A9J6CBN9_POLVA|nr:hypothetical protein PVAND_009039 [Polypedilum vanderplanki]
MNALASAHPHGKAESVFDFTEDHELEFNGDAIKELTKIIQIIPSIKNPNNILENKESWMGSADEPLTGFSWCAGSTRDTSGISVWNDAFLHTDMKSGEKIAIIVMDTQGLFDNETTTNKKLKKFSLSVHCFHLSSFLI